MFRQPYLKERLTCTFLAEAGFLTLPIWCTLLHQTSLFDRLPAWLAQDATGVLVGAPFWIALAIYAGNRPAIYDPRSYVTT